MIKVTPGGQIGAPNYSGFEYGVGFFEFYFPFHAAGFFAALVLQPELLKQWLSLNCAAVPVCYFIRPAQLSKA